MFAKHPVLFDHQLGIVDFVRSGRKVAVPKQGHLFDQGARRMEHAMEPPSGNALDIPARSDRRYDLPRLQLKSLGGLSALLAHQNIDGLGRTGIDQLLDLGRFCAKATPAHQVPDSLCVPGFLGGWLPGRPSHLRIDG